MLVSLTLSSCNLFGEGSSLGEKAPSLTWNNQSFDFGNLNIGSSASAIFKLSNNGNISAISCGNVTLSDNTNFSIISNSCGDSTMAVGVECEIEIASHPTTIGRKELTISRSCADDVIVQTPEAQIVAMGVMPVLNWAPMSKTFGSVAIGQNSSTQTFTLSNSGNISATGCSAPVITDAVNFAIVSDSCSNNNLNNSASCTVGVRANPTSLGLHEAMVSRTCTVGGISTTTLDQITVTGTGAPSLAWSPLTNNFGNVVIGQNSTDQTFTLSNSGNIAATSCGAPMLTDIVNFSLVSNTCGSNDVAVSGSCVAVVQAHPLTLGLKSTTLYRNCTVGGMVQTTTNEIKATGAGTPVLDWNLLAKDFGTVTSGLSSSAQAFTLSNSGPVAATGCSAPTISDNTNFTISSDTCSTNNLNGSSSCSVSVVANPISQGLKRATLSRVCTVGGTVSTTSNEIQVTSVFPTIDVTSNSYNFGTVQVGDSSSSEAFTFTNNGTLEASGCAAVTLSDTTNFSITADTCGTANLAVSSSCVVSVQAHPGSNGHFEAMLSRYCTVGNGIVSTSGTFSVEGTAANLAWDRGDYDFGTVAVGGSSNKNAEFNLTNTGSVDATGCSAPVLTDTTNFEIVSDNCSTNDLAASSSCLVEVRARPSAKAEFRATLSRTCSVGGYVETKQDGLVVNGMDAPVLSWNPLSFDYGDTDIGGRLSNKKIFTLTNSGTMDATDCQAPELSDLVNFIVIRDNCDRNDLRAGDSCTLEVSARPQAVGVFSLNISRLCNNGGDQVSAETNKDQIVVNAVEPSVLAWNNMTYDFGGVDVDSVSASALFTLTNGSKSDDAKGCSAPVLSDTTNFTIVNDNCGTNDLAQGASCDVEVAASPSNPLNYTAQLSRTCSNLGTARTEGDGIIVNGVEPKIDMVWDQLVYEFRDVEVGTYTTKANRFTLTNNSKNDATGCSAPQILDPLNFSIVQDTCGTADLVSGGTCDIDLIAQPQSLGIKRTTLKRICTVGGSARTTYNEISVNGVPSTAYIAWQNLSYDFGAMNVGDSSGARRFTLMNTAAKSDATGCHAPVLSNSTDFSLANDHCDVNDLVAGDSCDVEVIANPQSAGVKTTTLTRLCDNGGMARTTLDQIVVTASGASSGPLSWAPLTYDFGDLPVGEGDSKEFILSNSAHAPTATGCSAPVLSNTTDFSLSNSKKYTSCETNDLNASENCGIVVTAEPQSIGVKTTTLSRTCTVGGVASTTTDQIVVNGIAAAPNLVLSPLVYNFGTMTLGANSSYIFGINNSGLADATGCSAPVLSNSTDFSIVSNTCGTNDMLAQDGCAVTLQANPQSTGRKTTTLSRTCTVGGTVSTTADEIVLDAIVGADWKQAYNEDNFKVVKAGSTSNIRSFYFRNPSSIDLSGCTTPAIDNVTDFAIVSNNCAAGTVSAASICEVRLQANPITTGSKVTTLSRSCNETGTLNIGIGATGASASTSISQIAISDYTGCVLLNDGTRKCWGSNMYSQFANGEYSGVSLSPVYSPSLSNLTQMSMSQMMGCARVSDGTVKCWGMLATGTNNGMIYSSPIQINGVANATQVATGNDFACALISDGTVKCWGRNGFGQLGDGTQNFSSSGVVVSGITNAIQVATGYATGCALLSDSSIKCWGLGTSGQLGNGAAVSSLTPVAVSGISNAIDIKSASSHSCAILSDATVKCWGYNEYGQLGDGSTTGRTSPVVVSGLSSVSQISLGSSSSCAVLTNGTMKCWGQNNYGQIDGGLVSANRTTPVLISGVTNAVQSASSGMATCVLLSNDSVKCWGYNYYGISGDATRLYQTKAQAISLSNATQVSNGMNHSCARISDGTVKCWGLNNYGQLGDGTLTNSVTPVTVSGITTATQVAAGHNATCALLSNNTIKCWGYNEYGQLGNNTNANSTTPVLVSGIANATQISFSSIHACARLSDSTIKCWGHGSQGSLGQGANAGSFSPVTVSGITNATQVSLGTQTSCARLNDGTVKCWGYNGMGQLGDGSSSDSNIPVAVAGLSNVTKISNGAYHVCAILSDSTAKCWGQNSEGRLGNGTSSNSNVPVVVTNLSDMIDISAGQYHSCALFTNNKVKCWGGNTHGSLGDGTDINRNVPVYSLSMNSISSLGQGGAANYQCNVKSDGTVLCVGDNRYSQIGVNEFALRTILGL